MARGTNEAPVHLHCVAKRFRRAKRHAWPVGRGSTGNDAIVPLGRIPVSMWRDFVEDQLSRLPVPIGTEELPSWERSRTRATSEIERVAHERGYDTATVMFRSSRRHALLVLADPISCTACESGLSCTPSS